MGRTPAGGRVNLCAEQRPGRHRGRDEAGDRGGVPLGREHPGARESHQGTGRQSARVAEPRWATGSRWHQDQLRQAWSPDHPLARPGAGVAHRAGGQGQKYARQHPAASPGGPVQRLARQQTRRGRDPLSPTTKPAPRPGGIGLGRQRPAVDKPPVPPASARPPTGGSGCSRRVVIAAPHQDLARPATQHFAEAGRQALAEDLRCNATGRAKTMVAAVLSACAIGVSRGSCRPRSGRRRRRRTEDRGRDRPQNRQFCVPSAAANTPRAGSTESALGSLTLWKTSRAA